MTSHATLHHLCRSVILLFALGCTQLKAIEPETVTVYTTQALPVTNSESITAKYIILDEADAVLSEWSSNLPNTQAQAQAELLRRLETPEGKAQVERLGVVYQGIVEAWSRGINKLPAILINIRYVVYGVYDVDQAVELVRSAP